MAAAQKRWLTQPNSKIAKHPDLAQVLRSDATWEGLSQEKREELYELLPPIEGGHDINVHPMSTALRPYIEEEIRLYQTDLVDGKETKKWREEAMKASRDRRNGAWDKYKELQREEDWGKREPKTKTEEGEGDNITREDATKEADGAQS